MARPAAIRPVARDDNFANVMIHGEPGVGKSVLAGSGAKTLLLLNNSDEASPAADHGSKADKWIIPDYKELEEAYEYCRHEGVNDYDWIWIDNGTLLQEQGMDMIMEDLVAKKPARNRWVPDQHEYLMNQNQLATYIRRFASLHVNFGITSHTMRFYDEDDGDLLYIPMFQGGQGQLSQKLCGYMNVVGYMHARQGKEGQFERTLLLTKRSKYYAKSRFSGLQGTMKDPSIPKIESAIKSKFPNFGKRKADAAPPARKTTSTRRTA